ncbi:MAG: response regulator [Propionibacteriaceae bacterium]
MGVRVVVADDQEMIRAGIVMLLSATPDIEVVAEAGTGDEAVALSRELDPDVVVMDLRMPGLNGIEATRILSADRNGAGADHPVRVLALTTFADDDTLYGALRAGASGYLLKHAAPSDLATAIRKVAGGDSWLDPLVAGKVIAALSTLPEQVARSTDLSGLLTPREREILGLVALGLSNPEISTRLVLSEATVKTHVSRVIVKTGCRDRAQVVALAYQSGLVSRAVPQGRPGIDSAPGAGAPAGV